MATYRTPSLSLHDACVPGATLGYYRLRFYQAMHEFILREFNRLAASEQPLAKKALAKRINRDASQITVWLRDPNNMEFESFSDLMVGMGVDPRRIVAQLAIPAQGPPKEETSDEDSRLLVELCRAQGQKPAETPPEVRFAKDPRDQTGVAFEPSAFLREPTAHAHAYLP